MKMTIEEFLAESNNDAGYCTECCAITRDDCEPDAENYECPDCGSNSVCGIELAMISDLIEVDEDEE